MLSGSALYRQRRRTAYFVVTNFPPISLYSSAIKFSIGHKAISEQLASAKHMGVLQVSPPANVQTEIEQIGEILSSSLAATTGKIINSSSDIRDVLNSVRVALITVSILMLTS
ncbi:hypothetical protein Bca4012_063300 [Brassica carinata]